jgi:hypothetical protein
MKWLFIIGLIVLVALLGLFSLIAGTKADRDYGRDDESGKTPPAR